MLISVKPGYFDRSGPMDEVKLTGIGTAASSGKDITMWARFPDQHATS
jgi:hypothetical protein